MVEVQDFRAWHFWNVELVSVFYYVEHSAGMRTEANEKFTDHKLAPVPTTPYIEDMEGLATQCVIAPRAAEVGLLSRAGAKSLEERSVLLGVLWGPSIQHWNAREGLFALTNRDPRVPA